MQQLLTRRIRGTGIGYTRMPIFGAHHTFCCERAVPTEIGPARGDCSSVGTTRGGQLVDRILHAAVFDDAHDLSRAHGGVVIRFCHYNSTTGERKNKPNDGRSQANEMETFRMQSVFRVSQGGQGGWGRGSSGIVHWQCEAYCDHQPEPLRNQIVGNSEGGLYSCHA